MSQTYMNSVKTNIMDDETINDSEDDMIENTELESCPSCGELYDDADFDFQICSHCGWNANKHEYEK